MGRLCLLLVVSLSLLTCQVGPKEIHAKGFLRTLFVCIEVPLNKYANVSKMFPVITFLKHIQLVLCVIGFVLWRF